MKERDCGFGQERGRGGVEVGLRRDKKELRSSTETMLDQPFSEKIENLKPIHREHAEINVQGLCHHVLPLSGMSRVLWHCCANVRGKSPLC